MTNSTTIPLLLPRPAHHSSSLHQPATPFPSTTTPHLLLPPPHHTSVFHQPTTPPPSTTIPHLLPPPAHHSSSLPHHTTPQSPRTIFIPPCTMFTTVIRATFLSKILAVSRSLCCQASL
ncbi:hypothetical protein FHG87_022523 [Trinorchestia longiramus]|nr:hypothetical protein FHG87_022523 [Trinorchestia longiramus]